MPTGTLPKEGKALWEKVYNDSQNSSCDKECAAKKAWGAVRQAGWVKGEDGQWHKKAVYAQFSLAISRASYDKATNRMNWRAVASDTDTDFFNDNMTLSLFNDFVDRIQKVELPPEQYRSSFWNGGTPYMSISHYSDQDGKAVPGQVEAVYIDGTRLKAKGYFEDNPLGRACFKSVCNDLYGEEPHPEGKVRISIAFLDFAHKHKSNGYMWERGNPDEPICEECIREMLTDTGEDGKEFIKGLLVHLALTRKPANSRTEIATEVDKMAIKTRKDDALSIVGDDAEAQSEVERIAEAAEMVGKSELVIKSEAEDDVEEEIKADEIVTESKVAVDEEDQEPSEDDDMEKDESLVKESVTKELVEENPMSGIDVKQLVTDVAEMKSLIEKMTTPTEPEAHPLDEAIATLRSAYDQVIVGEGTADEKLAALQDPFNAFSQVIIEQVRSIGVQEEPQTEPVTDVVSQAVSGVMQILGPQLEELKSLITARPAPVAEGQPQHAMPVRDLVNRRSILPQPRVPQTSLQNGKSTVKSGMSISEVVNRTT